jgi:hypothetical protein
MNDKRKLLVGVFVALLLTAGVVWFAGTGAPDAPDCSTVSYDGDGTEANPYEVSNVEQLQCINEQGLDANYVQVSDIDASGTASWNGGGDGFEPVGDPDALGTPFNGTFEGQKHKITGLTIYEHGNWAGLFTRVGTGGKVKNVSLIDANIDGPLFVGGLVGTNKGTIKNSYVSGSVEKVQVGGLVGVNKGKIKNSYSTASVEGIQNVGGLVGSNDGTINNSYAIGSVSGSEKVGGLAGYNSGIISKSYATGSVRQGDGAGGLVGIEKEGGTTIESYWDVETTGQSTSAGNSTGLTTSEMVGSAAKSNMRGFDFTDTWETVTREHVRGGYPVLSWQAEKDTHD